MSGQAKPWILGVNTSHHHGSMCLLRGDEIVVAVQEERLTRNKRDALRRPRPLSLNYCLESARISEKDLELVVGCGVSGQQYTAAWLKAIFPNTPILTIPHHFGHAVGAFATSGFSEAAILIVDGAGSSIDDLPANELRTVKRAVFPYQFRWLEIASLYQASGTNLINLEKHLGDWLAKSSSSTMQRFASLGGLYAAVAELIFGSSTDVGELAGKVMGLAAYAQPEIPSSEFFEIVDGRLVFHNTVAKRFASKLEPWPAHQPIYKTLAASVQVALEEALLYLVRHLKALCPCNNLVFSGGVALNSIANERIVREGGFQNVYFMPAAEDSGNAIGAAYYGLWQLTKQNTQRRLRQDAMGRKYSLTEIDAAIALTPAVQVCQSNDPISKAVDLLTEGKIVGWFQGRSELGPRALGQRSIICDPRRLDGKEYLNRRVKHREDFRPFAPVVLLEEADKWFELDGVAPDCPFMLRVCRFRDDKKALVPAVVHVDGTGRVQTVTTSNGKFYDLVHAFFMRTGVPIILNTSFNVMGEPIVECPDDALWCLLYTGVDYCILEDRIVTKAENYHSLLDLYPYLTVSSYQLKTPIIDGQFKAPAVPEVAAVSFFVKNQWGEFESSGVLKWLPLLKLIDGTKTGWTLFEELKKKDNRLDEVSFIRTLGLLRRRAILNFRSF